MRIISLALLAFFTLGTADVFSQSKFLSADEAFKLSVARDPSGAVKLIWDIADGHYLYRKHISVREAGRDASLTLDIPPGEKKNDPNFGMVEIYHSYVAAIVGQSDGKQLKVFYQGCKENSICYPPIAKVVDLQTLSVTE